MPGPWATAPEPLTIWADQPVPAPGPAGETSGSLSPLLCAGHLTGAISKSGQHPEEIEVTIPSLEKQLEIQGHPAGECWGQNLNLRVYPRHPAVYPKGWGDAPSAFIKVCQFSPPQCSPTSRSNPGLEDRRSPVDVYWINEQRAKPQPRLTEGHLTEGGPLQMVHSHKPSTEVTVPS